MTNVKECEKKTKLVHAIIDRRHELGLSQRDLAKLCHLPQSSIARLEANIASPRLDTLEKILAPLGLTIELKKEPPDETGFLMRSTTRGSHCASRRMYNLKSFL